MAKKTDPSAQKAKPVPRNALLDAMRERRQYQFMELCNRATLLGEGGQARRRLLEALALKIGMNLEDIGEEQEAEWQKLLAQTKEQEEAAAALLKKQSVRQRQALRTITQHRERFEYNKGNPHTSICLWRTAGAPSFVFNPQTFSRGTVQILPPAPTAVAIQAGQNILRINAEAVGNARVQPLNWNPVAALDLFTLHEFEATVPHGGSLSVTANYAPSGVISLGAPGDLFFAGSASAEVALFMFVVIEGVSGEKIELPLGNTLTIVDQEIRASWNGKNKVIPVGTVNGVAYQLTHTNAINVQAGDLVRVTAGFDIYLTAMHRGRAAMTFAPDPNGFNVPMVLVKIDS